jgi:hypothetical protein
MGQVTGFTCELCGTAYPDGGSPWACRACGRALKQPEAATSGPEPPPEPFIVTDLDGVSRLLHA